MKINYYYYDILHKAYSTWVVIWQQIPKDGAIAVDWDCEQKLNKQIRVVIC